MESWRLQQLRSFTCLDALASFLNLSEEQKGALLNRKHFPLRVPERLAKKMAKGTLDDPLFRQFVPLQAEALSVEGFSCDPVGDLSSQKSDSSRLLQKYYGRALLMLTGACALHCRYCFRQYYPYTRGKERFCKELAAIRSDTSLQEIILSGGDPLSLSDESLSELFCQLAEIPHLKRVRIHTRFPIAIPERITDRFCRMVTALPQQVWVVLHINHPEELGEDLFVQIKKLQMCGIPILTHTVLLKGINDFLEPLELLFRELIDHGIMPYYLFALDPVAGSAHFHVEETIGLQLIAELEKHLPGFGVPKFVREIPGHASKTALHPVENMI